MHNLYFQKLEEKESGTNISLNSLLDNLAFNSQDLVTVITQDYQSKDVLMLAWANKIAIEKTINSGLATYWSRTRNSLWLKGKTSSHIQKIRSISIDCDGDAILYQVDQVGYACHTNRSSCFYVDIDLKNKKVCIKH